MKPSQLMTKLCALGVSVVLGWIVYNEIMQNDPDMSRDISTQQSRLDRIHRVCSAMNHSYITTPYTYSGDRYPILREFLLIDTFHKVILNSLPKTGSTTWRLAFLNSSGTYILAPGQKVGFVHGRRLFQSVKGIYTQPAVLMRRGDVIEALNQYTNVLTVRHPLDRLESAYQDLVISYNYVHIREKILKQRVLDEVSLKRQAHNGSHVGFDEFLYYILRHGDRHWDSMVKTSVPCQVNYRYIAKTETMARDLATVTHSLLSGHGATVNMNIKRAHSTKSQTYSKGRFLPLFTNLGDHNKALLIKKVANAFKDDFELFGYTYHINKDGEVYGTCEKYDDIEQCV